MTEKYLNENIDKNDVTHIIVKNDMCIGCGICAGVCPSECLEMQWSARGELIPVKVEDCCQQCGICIKVCPFSDSDINQDKIAEKRFSKISDVNFQTEIGYYLECYVGYSLRNKQREFGASGGMATWFLQTLLESKIVDGVICVVNDSRNNSDRLFRFKVVTELAELQAAAKSKYYPVEISEVIRKILHEKEEKRYAVIGVPCLIYGLNLAKKKNKKLGRQLVIMVSLACGQLPNRFYTEFLSKESGVPINSLKSVDYRIKHGTTNPGNFAFCAFGLDQGTGKNISWLSSPSHLWHNFYFVHNACNYCDDVFGETADVVFMDAWLSDYTKDPKGHSLIIVRSQEAYEIIQAGVREGLCFLEKISVDKVIQSQLSGLYKKRCLIQGRLYRAKLLKKRPPVKRVIAKARVYYQNYFLINLNEKIISESKRLWPHFRNDDNNKGFMNAMNRYEMYIRILQFISVANSKFKKLLKDPFGVSSRVINRLLKRFEVF